MSAKSLVTGLLILAVWGCQSTPVERAPQAPAAAPEAATPDQLMQRAAAASSPRQAGSLRLQAARLYFDDGRLGSARDALETLDPAGFGERSVAEYLLLQGQLNIADGHYQAARTALRGVDPALLTSPLSLDLAEAALLNAEGRPGAAARHLMRTDVPEGQAQRVNDAIWLYMNQLSALHAAAPATDDETVVRGWWALRQAMLESFGLDDQRSRLSAWQAAWPDHPASRAPPKMLVAMAENTWRPTRVGLMLPLSGPLSRAGQAVRDGFVATYLRFGRDIGYDITLYDTAGGSLGNLYERALVDGMDLLIGPLRKENVEIMNGLNPQLPVLALNYLADAPAAPGVLQLGLAIEDEAASIADRLRRDGARRLLLLHNEEDWSIRAANELKARWNGPITEQRITDLKTITESVGAAMFVTASESRRDDLAELLRQDVQFLPRARGDVDAVVALVTNIEANALVPALRFHFAEDLPVYASSQSLRGAGAKSLEELSGFLVSELPWFLTEDDTYAQMNKAFDLEADPLSSLYALGVDAFRVCDRLPLFTSGAAGQLLGSTGGLRLVEGGRFARELAWGQVARSVLVPAPWTQSR